MSMLLEGIRVVDWTQWHAGPFGSVLLADLGAEVIHVEHPRTPDAMRGFERCFGVPMQLPQGRNLIFELVNRNKKGIVLDLAHPEGREAMYRLVAKSDVFMTNFRGAEKLGMDYQTLRQHNPRLVYALGTGYGDRGPDRGKPSMELTAFARSGAMMVSGEPDSPPVLLPPALGDRMTGIFLAYGVIAALLGRERLGIPQQVTVSQLGAMLQPLGLPLQTVLWQEKELQRQERARARNPLANWYRCQDGRWIILSMASSRYWPLLCQAAGVPEIGSDPRFASMALREEHCEELVGILDRRFATRTAEQWVEVLRPYDLIVEVVQTMSDVAQDPQVIANNYIVDWDHPVLGNVRFEGSAVDFSETPVTLRSAAPEVGEHTEEVLSELLGYGWEEIIQLKEKGVI